MSTRSRVRDRFVTDYIETHGKVRRDDEGAVSDHSEYEDEDDEEDEEGERSPPLRTTKSKKKTKQTHDQEEEEEDTEEKQVEPEVPDMRAVYPIDENHGPSVLVLARLSAYMHTMSRHFSLLELMGYMTTWLALGRALVRVNDQQYRTQSILFSDGEVKCTCFIFEILQRLHLTAYMVFRHSMESLRSALVHSESPCLIPEQADANDPTTVLNSRQLKKALLVIAEMCRVALDEFHPAWKDMISGLSNVQDAQLRERTLFRYSATHTAVLGTLATHLLQAQVVITFWDRPETVPAEESMQLAWETASVLALLSQGGLVPEWMQSKFPYMDLMSQLRLLTFRRRLTECMKKQQWAHAEWLARHIAGIMPDDEENQKIWHKSQHNARLTEDPLLAVDSLAAIQQLHSAVVQRKGTTVEQIKAMDLNALSTVYRGKVYNGSSRRKLSLLGALPEVKLRVVVS